MAEFNSIFNLQSSIFNLRPPQLHNYGSPGYPGAETQKQYGAAGTDCSHFQGFVEGNRDTGRGGVAVTLDVVKHLVSGNFIDC